MWYPGLFKGIIAFIITLAVGVGAAYVTGTFKPAFNKYKKESKRAWCRDAKQKHWNLTNEVEQLKRELELLKTENEELKKHPHWENHAKFERQDLLQRVNADQIEKEAKERSLRFKFKPNSDGVGSAR